MSRVLLAAALALAPACAAPLERHAFARGAMGTEFRIVLYARDAEQARAAAEAALARIAALDRALSDYDPASELSRLGARSDAGAPTAWIRASDELFHVLDAGLCIARESDGAFDPTVGPLTALWRRARRQGELPDAAALAAACARTGHARLELDGGSRSVRLHAAGMRLDLGGIAKGYALDEALAALAAHGVERALVDGGGDVAAGAPPPGERGWRVAIAGLDSADFRADRAGTGILLAHAALATSGDLERSFELGGTRFSHILDPRTGMPLVERRLASVIAPDGTTADAWATALSVLGPAGLERLERLAQTPGVAGRLALARADGRVEVLESEGFPAELSSAGPPDP
jgi:thiamine biosynthesis lipoprotein